MMTKHKVAPFALTLVLGLLVAAPQAAQSAPAHRAKDSLVGTWRMTSLEVGSKGDLKEVPYSGEVIFTEAGTMSVQAMNPDTSALDTAYTVNGYEAFYGDVAVNRRAGTFVVTVKSALARALIGQSLTRVFDVTGDTLVLTPADPSEGWRATYRRS